MSFHRQAQVLDRLEYDQEHRPVVTGVAEAVWPARIQEQAISWQQRIGLSINVVGGRALQAVDKFLAGMGDRSVGGCGRLYRDQEGLKVLIPQADSQALHGYFSVLVE